MNKVLSEHKYNDFLQENLDNLLEYNFGLASNINGNSMLNYNNDYKVFSANVLPKKNHENLDFEAKKKNNKKIHNKYQCLL